MNVLITGATGFIGRALCRRVAQEGWHVSGTVRDASDRKRLPPDVETIPTGSLGPDTPWSALIPKGTDVVVHLAARTHVMRETANDPLRVYRSINVAGAEHLAQAAARLGVRRFVFLSSVKVNGEGRAEPYTERNIPAPEDPYGISKWEAEQALHRIAAETGMEIVVIRPPLVYGPGVKANFLALINVVRRGIPLPFAGVQNRRSLLYLGNLVDAIITVCIRPGAAGQTYLVSDGVDVSTPELIRRIAGVFGRPARLFSFSPHCMRLAGRLLDKTSAIERLLGSLVVDSSKIQRELDWKAPYTMEQGLKETAEWVKGEG